MGELGVAMPDQTEDPRRASFQLHRKDRQQVEVEAVTEQETEDGIPRRSVLVSYAWKEKGALCLGSTVVEFEEDTLLDRNLLFVIQQQILDSPIAKKKRIRKRSFHIVGFSIFEG